MPTVGWIWEDALYKFWEGRPWPVSRPVHVCKRCGREFSSLEDLRRHVSMEHPLELPALYVNGKPLLRESVLRSHVRDGEVGLVQRTRWEVQKGGGPWHRLAMSEFCTQFARPTNSTWNLRLVNERAEDNSITVEEYHIWFRIPDSATLNAIDKHFIQTLVKEELRHPDLERFETGLPLDDVPAPLVAGIVFYNQVKFCHHWFEVHL